MFLVIPSITCPVLGEKYISRVVLFPGDIVLISRGHYIIYLYIGLIIACNACVSSVLRTAMPDACFGVLSITMSTRLHTSTTVPYI